MTQTPIPTSASPAAPPAAEAGGLPDAIATALPPDPYEQLEVARKITAVAVAARLELEAARLRQKLADKDRLAAELADRPPRSTRLSVTPTPASAPPSTTMLSLPRRGTRSRTLGNLQEASNAETVDIRTCEQSVAKANSWNDGVAHSRHHHHPVYSLTDGSTEIESKLTVTHITPRLTSDPAAKPRSSATSPRRYSTAMSPKLTASATSPRLEGHMVMPPWLPSSTMSSAANSPPRGHSISGRTTRVDGKEFFRQARSRLSYEQFAAFLANIKELNAHRQSREETLQKADEIFGSENKDLFMSFQILLSRSL
uniref:At4g15545-like C-terminal domain-containing protein n=1 Tax=Leersia perrieri TaxID=77586 RepID=A0A0D9V664_9ORYZ